MKSIKNVQISVKYLYTRILESLNLGSLRMFIADERPKVGPQWSGLYHGISKQFPGVDRHGFEG